MQGQEPTQANLKEMTGLEFDVQACAQEGVFVVTKQIRESADVVHPEAVYYIVLGTIYQAPALYAVFAARLGACLHYLQEGLEIVEGYVQFDPFVKPNTHFYDFAAATASSTASAAAVASSEDQEEKPKQQERTAEDLLRTQQNYERSARILSSIFAKFSVPGQPEVKPPPQTGVAMKRPVPGAAKGKLPHGGK